MVLYNDYDYVVGILFTLRSDIWSVYDINANHCNYNMEAPKIVFHKRNYCLLLLASIHHAGLGTDHAWGGNAVGLWAADLDVIVSVRMRLSGRTHTHTHTHTYTHTQECEREAALDNCAHKLVFLCK